MAMLAELVEVVIGVDSHKRTHTAAVVKAVSGAVVEQVTVPATLPGYQELLQLAARQPGQRVWAIESTGGLHDWALPSFTVASPSLHRR